MIELGDFTPAATVGPQRIPGGGTVLGRLTTTDEQRAEAVQWVADQLAKRPGGPTTGRARILWARGEATILEVRVKVEHLEDRAVFVPHSWTETMQSGAVVPRSEEARYRKLADELRDLTEKDMLK